MDLGLRRFSLSGTTLAVIISFLLICAVAPLIEPRGVSALANLRSINKSQDASDDNPNVITAGAASIIHGSVKAFSSVGVGLVGSGVSVARLVTNFDKGITHGVAASTGLVVSGTAKSVVFTAKAVSKIPSLAAYPVDHLHITNVSSIIRPQDNTPTPTITQLRAQQASIIQQGTVDLQTTPGTVGAGGACDAGAGNGGYPAKWCDSPMDTISTVFYSGQAINRECTSYAYWYFTSIEGHTDFHVTGDAKYWAYDSNYPTHPTPAVGAIAVETAGAYGHVAIVQSLPGQTYEGKVTPQGYILVSEMNYDWNGHFRYSYSPISKFYRYIYP